MNKSIILQNLNSHKKKSLTITTARIRQICSKIIIQKSTSINYNDINEILHEHKNNMKT